MNAYHEAYREWLADIRIILNHPRALRDRRRAFIPKCAGTVWKQGRKGGGGGMDAALANTSSSSSSSSGSEW